MPPASAREGRKECPGHHAGLRALGKSQQFPRTIPPELRKSDGRGCAAKERGSLGFADPQPGSGYAYVTSQMGTTLTGDPRDVALREALYSALRLS
jgi:hypothetical protein